jgi:hypothetical protein
VVQALESEEKSDFFLAFTQADLSSSAEATEGSLRPGLKNGRPIGAEKIGP